MSTIVNKRMTTSIIVIGGGAAGMMCIARILQEAETQGILDQIHVTLFEKNTRLGRKVAISGGGRCNVTTGITDKKTLLDKYTRWSDFFKESLGKFGPKKVRSWFEENGLALKCEDDLRVFPASDTGEDVIQVFTDLFARYPQVLDIYLGESIQSVSRENERFTVVSKNRTLESDLLCITTGGNAYAHTGSSGDGYNFARSLGHTITTLGPSLSSFELAESFTKELSGLALERATIRSSDGRYEAHGAVLMTHFGISGPGVFVYSSQVAFEPISPVSPLPILLAPLASWTFESFERHILMATEAHPTRQIGTILREILPSRFVEAIATTHPELSLTGATFSKSLRKDLCHLLSRGIPLTIVARRPGDEFVTAGGVSTSEIDPNTLASRICPGLFLAGEVIDIDGVTGGFNLQVAWATGWRAGEGIINEIK